MKLRPADIVEIRKSHKKGTELAIQFGVSESTISHIRTGHTWADVATDVEAATRKIVALIDAEPDLSTMNLVVIGYIEIDGQHKPIYGNASILK